jgi:hypothetical protein
MDGGDEAVAASACRGDEAGILGGVVQRSAEFVDRDIEAVIEVDEGIGGPEACAKLFTTNDFPRPLQKDG